MTNMATHPSGRASRNTIGRIRRLTMASMNAAAIATVSSDAPSTAVTVSPGMHPGRREQGQCIDKPEDGETHKINNHGANRVSHRLLLLQTGWRATSRVSSNVGICMGCLFG